MNELAIRRLPHEEWKVVTSGYLLSNKGRWYSEKTNRLLKQFPNSSGYLRATIQLNKRKKHCLTHIKVIELFGDCCGKSLPGYVKSLRELGLSIDHVDRDKQNNVQSNLEIVTHQENCIRKFRETAEQDGCLPY